MPADFDQLRAFAAPIAARGCDRYAPSLRSGQASSVLCGVIETEIEPRSWCQPCQAARALGVEPRMRDVEEVNNG